MKLAASEGFQVESVAVMWERCVSAADPGLSDFIFSTKRDEKNSSWEVEGINALCQLIGQWVTDSLGGGIDSRKEIDLWLLQYHDFKCGRTNTNYAERSGHPNSAVVPENTKKLQKLVLADCKLKLREIAEELKISEGSVCFISNYFLMIIKDQGLSPLSWNCYDS